MPSRSREGKTSAIERKRGEERSGRSEKNGRRMRSERERESERGAEVERGMVRVSASELRSQRGGHTHERERQEKSWWERRGKKAPRQQKFSWKIFIDFCLNEIKEYSKSKIKKEIFRKRNNFSNYEILQGFKKKMFL
jgi:hypothetical protein